jgi:ketosteroid isomerase-like protein
MQEAQNTKVVQDAYAAFGRNDIPALLDTLDENVVWNPVIGAASYVPTAGERRGKAAVAEFFRIVSEEVLFKVFEPKEFVAQGDKVVSLGHYRAGVPTGRTFESDFVMVFTVRNGKIVAFQEFSDSAAINAAYEPIAV